MQEASAIILKNMTFEPQELTISCGDHKSELVLAPESVYNYMPADPKHNQVKVNYKHSIFDFRHTPAAAPRTGEIHRASEGGTHVLWY